MSKRWIIVLYIILAIITTFVGLATRKYPEYFSPFIAKYGGDILWATLFFFLVRAVSLKKSILFTGIITYAFGVLIELQQLYQAVWIIKVRQTFIGSMLLGHGFLWSDLLSYAAGVVIGIIIAMLIEYRKQPAGMG